MAESENSLTVTNKKQSLYLPSSEEMAKMEKDDIILAIDQYMTAGRIDFKDIPTYHKAMYMFHKKMMNVENINTPQKALLAVSFLDKVGLPVETFIKQAYYVGSTLTLMTEAMTALIRKEGHPFVIVRSAEPMYYTDNPRNNYLEGKLLLRHVKDIHPEDKNKPEDKQRFKEHEEPIPVTFIHKNQKFHDMVTTIKCKRKNEGDDMWQYIDFKLSDAYKADLIVGKENTWGKYLDDMMYNRCATRMKRRVYSDIGGGIYSTEEMTDPRLFQGKPEEAEEASYTDVTMDSE